MYIFFVLIILLLLAAWFLPILPRFRLSLGDAIDPGDLEAWGKEVLTEFPEGWCVVSGMDDIELSGESYHYRRNGLAHLSRHVEEGMDHGLHILSNAGSGAFCTLRELIFGKVDRGDSAPAIPFELRMSPADIGTVEVFLGGQLSDTQFAAAEQLLSDSGCSPVVTRPDPEAPFGGHCGSVSCLCPANASNLTSLQHRLMTEVLGVPDSIGLLYFVQTQEE
jgi:hypothetical protein